MHKILQVALLSLERIDVIYLTVTAQRINMETKFYEIREMT